MLQFAYTYIHKTMGKQGMNITKTIFVGVVVAIAGALFAMPAQSASASSASLSIVPKKNYTIEAGKSVKDTLIIRNIDREEELELTLRVVDFTFTDDGGTPKLLLDEDAPQTTWSLKSFLKVPKTVKIAPKSSETLDISVDIPSNQGAGSFYSAIVYSSGEPDGGNVGLSASGVTLAFVNIPGDVDEKLEVEQFGAYDEASRKYSYLATTQPLNIAYTLKNSGNVVQAPVGSITVTDLFGNERRISNINPNQSLALIDQTRTFTSCIELEKEQVNFNGEETESTACGVPGLWPGFYSLNLDAFYGQNGNTTQEVSAKSWFIYAPIWFIVLLLILAIAIWYYSRKLIRKFKGASRTRQAKKSSRRKR